MASPLATASFNLSRVLNLLIAARYFALFGLAVLVCDHVANFNAERRLIWTARWSPAKFAFVANRYIVFLTIMVVFLVFSGFDGLHFSNEICTGVWDVGGVILTLSMALQNGLVTSHVIQLWDHNRTIARLIWTFYGWAYATSLSFYIMACVVGDKLFYFGAPFNSCLILHIHPFYIPAWASPLLYELILLSLLIWNAIDRPRQSDVSLLRTLRRDGIQFSAITVTLRTIQVGVISTLDPSNFILLSFFNWAIITVTLNHFILSMRRAELKAAAVATSSSTPPYDLRDSFGSPIGHASDIENRRGSDASDTSSFIMPYTKEVIHVRDGEYKPPPQPVNLGSTVANMNPLPFAMYHPYASTQGSAQGAQGRPVDLPASPSTAGTVKLFDGTTSSAIRKMA